MTVEHTSKMKALFIVINAGFADNIIDILYATGARGATILNARGEGKQHKLFMGITIDSEKEMILCVTDEGTAEKAMLAIKEKVGLKTPAHSVCFTMPVDQIVGINMPLGDQSGDPSDA